MRSAGSSRRGKSHRKHLPHPAPWRSELHRIIFEAGTPGGKAFDVALLWVICLSVGAVMLESIETVSNEAGTLLRVVEWIFTGLFTLEYLLRLCAVQRPWRYATSFFGIVDLLAVLPTYLTLFFVGTPSLLVIRALRLLRIFRIFKLHRYLSEAGVLMTALRQSRPKITVFLGSVLTIVMIMGTLMYLIEGEENGFTSIPRGMYWAIVTLTTVGYGDIAPRTAAGQALASVVMVMGYSIIAIPTGIVSVELAQASKVQITTRACPVCSGEGHDYDALYCKHCGEILNTHGVEQE